MRRRRSWCFAAALLVVALPGCELLLDAGDRRLSETSSSTGVSSSSSSMSSSSVGGGGAGGAASFDFTIAPTVVRMSAASSDSKTATLTITHTPDVHDLLLSVEEAPALDLDGIHIDVSVSDDVLGELTFSTTGKVGDRHVVLHVKLTDGANEVVHPLDLVVAGPPGSLDHSFGVGGEYLGTEPGAVANALVLSPNDELLVVGNLGDDALFLRLDPDGKPIEQHPFDAVTTPVITTTGKAVALAPDGVVYVGGEVDGKQYLQRLAAGAPLGAALVGGTLATARSVVLPLNGTSVHVLGATSESPFRQTGFHALPDLATSDDIEGTWSATSHGGMALTKDGAGYWVVGAGHPNIQTQTFEVFAAKYTRAATNVLEAKYFGATDESTQLDIGAVALADSGADERLYAGGSRATHIFLAAIRTSSVDLDPSFGVDGMWSGSNGRMAGILPLPGGEILCVGSTGMSGFLQRLLADGTTDPSFGEAMNGWVIDIHPGSNHTAIIGDRFGRAIVAGSYDLGGDKLLLQRYWL